MRLSFHPNRLPVRGGEVLGLQLGKTARFMGVPFAKAPVGERRFLAPEALDLQSWEGVRESFRPGPMCPQSSRAGNYSGDEDCLTLNLWAPQDAVLQGPKKPVMVWIHGGAMVQGDSYLALPDKKRTYNARKLSELGDVVVVSLNYRLGTLGFLGTSGRFKGNLGLRDQIAALSWLQENIGAFGGDPHNITLFGESAGAWSICSLLAAPAALPFFQRAIMERGACTSRTKEDHRKISQHLLKQLDCFSGGDAAQQESCLQKKSAQELTEAWTMTIPKSVEAAELFTIAPFVDGDVLPLPPLEFFRTQESPKPLLHGTNLDEFAAITWLLRMRGFINFAKPKNLEAIVENPAAKAHVRPALQYYKEQGKDEGDLVDDVLFHCINYQLAEQLTAQGAAVYSYEFNMPAFFNKNIHTEEIPYVFQDEESRKKAPVAHRMGHRWATFARTGDPNAPGLLPWPQQAKKQLSRLEIMEEPQVNPWSQKKSCQLLQKFLPWTMIGRNAGWVPEPPQAKSQLRAEPEGSQK
ncbi:MAG: carboxylesterase family protein [Polyangiaceae bacterium]|nr:carboxylesterase family protein [Polyangiaceae bacterium]